MRQQINLYHYLPKPPTFRITLEMIKIVYVIFICILMLDFAAGLWHKHQYTKRIQSINQEWLHQQNRLAQIASEYGTINPQDLQNSMQELQKNIELNMRMLSQLFGHVRFSDDMMGFAQASTTGVWLTNIKISVINNTIQLQGKARQAEEAQQYLDQLQQQTIFSNMLFSLQDVQQQTPGTTIGNYMNFIISTKENENV